MYKKVFMIRSISLNIGLKQHLRSLIEIMFILVIIMIGKTSMAQTAKPVPNAVFTVNSKTYNLDQFRGHKIMLGCSQHGAQVARSD